MKRVKAACICQTLHFMLKEDISHAEADGSVMLKIIKQYNANPVGNYLD